MKRINVITIDGPAASGKGSLAISIANQFSLKLLDSGSLYRLFAFFEKNTDYSEIVEIIKNRVEFKLTDDCLLYTSPSPRDRQKSRMPSSA